MRHIVWDWNGTLLDDLDLVVESVNATLELIGEPQITADQYRDAFVRPVRLFYEKLLGRPVDDVEWQRFDTVFHETYSRRSEEVQLASDAVEAIELAASSGWTQSLLSMYPHDDLVPLVEQLPIRRHLLAVDGLKGSRGDRKIGHLEQHLRRLGTDLKGGFDPTGIVVIGDAVDDADSARGLGLRCVLYASGSHPRSVLAATGFPVADTLTDSLILAGVVED